MVSMVFLLTTFYFTITFSVVSYLDLKFRRIPNKIFKLAFAVSFILIIAESVFYFNNYILFVFGKFFFLF